LFQSVETRERRKTSIIPTNETKLYEKQKLFSFKTLFVQET